MIKSLQEYNCEEYFEDYYKDGLFHPTEAQIVFSHNEYRIDSYSDDLIIGEVYDDHDLIICYRKGRNGLWGRHNLNNEYCNMNCTLKEFTERYYQKNSEFWVNMKPSQIWNEVLNFYRLNMQRYNWDVNPLISLIDKFIESDSYKNMFTKGYKENIDISSINGFGKRPNNNMVKVYLSPNENTYNIHFMSNFFKEVNRIEFDENDYEEIIEQTNKWINN